MISEMTSCFGRFLDTIHEFGEHFGTFKFCLPAIALLHETFPRCEHTYTFIATGVLLSRFRCATKCTKDNLQLVSLVPGSSKDGSYLCTLD